MLSCHNLSIVREEKLVLANIGFTLFQTSTVLLQGKNGTGKTSLLKTLASINKQDEGTISFNEVNIYDALDEYRSLTFYLGHNYGIDKELTVYENLKFWSSINNSTEAVDAAIAVFSLEKYLDFPIYKLSSGWQKKTALSKALLSNALIWFLDEPFTNLDDEGCLRLSNMITTRCQQSGIVILTSHQAIPDLKCITINLEDYTG